MLYCSNCIDNVDRFVQIMRAYSDRIKNWKVMHDDDVLCGRDAVQVGANRVFITIAKLVRDTCFLQNNI